MKIVVKNDSDKSEAFYTTNGDRGMPGHLHVIFPHAEAEIEFPVAGSRIEIYAAPDVSIHEVAVPGTSKPETEHRGFE